MSCKIFQTAINDRDWGAPLSLATRDHLDGCEECRKVHDEQTGLRIIIGELEKVSAPADFEFRLRARIAAAEKARRPSFGERLKFSPSAVSVVLAAAFVLTAAMTLRFARVEQAGHVRLPAPVAETATSNPVPPPAVSIKESVTAPRPTVGEMIAGQSAPTKFVAEHRRKTVNGQNRLRRNVSAPPETEAASGSNTMVVTKAPVVSAQTAAVAIPVSSGVRPVSLILRNERGESRKVSIKSVSFGAQELAGRFNNSARGFSSAGEGVW